jgi:hypothetical protein
MVPGPRLDDASSVAARKVLKSNLKANIVAEQNASRDRVVGLGRLGVT